MAIHEVSMPNDRRSRRKRLMRKDKTTLVSVLEHVRSEIYAISEISDSEKINNKIESIVMSIDLGFPY